MKKIILIFTAMFLSATAFSALRTDSATSLRQSFPKNITNFKISGNTKVVFVCDNANFLEFPEVSNVQEFGNAKNFVVAVGDTMWLNTDALPFRTTLYVHVDSTVKGMNATFGGKSYGLVTGLVHGTVGITAKDWSRVVISKIYGDTIKSKIVSIYATDSAFVNVISPLLADTISLETQKAANIETNLVKCITLYSTEGEIDNGVKYRKVYSMGDKKNGYYGGNLETVYSKGWETSGKSHWSNKCPGKGGHNPLDLMSLNLGFYWGFNNWGSNPINGLARMDGAYELRTTPSSFQLELKLTVYPSRKTSIGAGVGYESDIYYFNNPYVTLNTESDVKFLEINDNQPYEGTCKTRLVTRYITFPVTFTYMIRPDWGAKISLIPGLNHLSSHTGMKYKIENDDNTMKFSDNPKDFVNRYKLDLRLAIRGKYFGFFIQPSLLPVFVNNDKKVYPIKIGIFI